MVYPPGEAYRPPGVEPSDDGDVRSAGHDHDAVTGDCATEAAFIRGSSSSAASAATLLDFACGTGGIAARLARALVSGLIYRPAWRGLPRAPGYPALPGRYARRLDARFDAIVCAYQASITCSGSLTGKAFRSRPRTSTATAFASTSPRWGTCRRGRALADAAIRRQLPADECTPRAGRYSSGRSRYSSSSREIPAARAEGQTIVPGGPSGMPWPGGSATVLNGDGIPVTPGADDEERIWFAHQSLT
jgi:hypothetical protein